MALAVLMSGCVATSSDDTPTTMPSTPPPRAATSHGLSSAALSATVEAMSTGEVPPESIRIDGDLVLVEIHHSDEDTVRRFLADRPSRITGHLEGVIEAYLHYSDLADLEAVPEVGFLRPPRRVNLVPGQTRGTS